jgi:hypothetical protein
MQFDDFLVKTLEKLELIFQWGVDNKGSFNDKTKMVLFQSPSLKRNLPFEFLSLHTSVGELKSSNSAVLLGVVLDKNLTWHLNTEKNIRSAGKNILSDCQLCETNGLFHGS